MSEKWAEAEDKINHLNAQIKSNELQIRLLRALIENQKKMIEAGKAIMLNEWTLREFSEAQINIMEAEWYSPEHMDKVQKRTITPLRKALKDLLDQVDSVEHVEFTRDIEQYKAQANWNDAIDQARMILERT